MRTALPIAAAACAALATPVAAEDGWQSLFDGESLDGWRTYGGNATFEIVDGAIVGTGVPDSPNTFLATEERFDDLILEVEVRVAGGMNSGVLFRADSTPEYQDGRVHGYQSEVDASTRAWSGGLHEEGRRGWLHPITRNERCRQAFRRHDWNLYRIEAIGDVIRTWVNDVPCSDTVDRGLSEGFVALQVHDVSGEWGDPGDTVSFRNVRIRTEDLKAARREMPDEVVQMSYLENELTPRERAEGWRLLWDGKTTDGWRGVRLDSFPGHGWEIADGMLTVLASGGAEARNGGDLVTTEEFRNFELELDFLITPGANSGIKYFVDPDLLRGPGSAIGLEFQILDDERHPDAREGVAGNRTMGSLYDLIAAGNLSEPDRDQKRVKPPGDWNRARIVSRGNHVEHWLNNVKVLEYERGTPTYRALVAYSKYAKWDDFGEWETGPILLQDHGDRVSFRSIKLREL
jgi:hypothetical protein